MASRIYRYAVSLSAPAMPPAEWAAISAGGDLLAAPPVDAAPAGIALAALEPGQSIACIRRGALTPHVVGREMVPLWTDAPERCWRRLLFAYPRAGADEAWPAGPVSLTVILGVGVAAPETAWPDMSDEERRLIAPMYADTLAAVQGMAPGAPPALHVRAAVMAAGYQLDRPYTTDPIRQSGAAALLRPWMAL